ncbi:MAG: adenylate/guanylate cyclase domain-containing protein [Pseudomonadota bacterium]|nr:adenylate/guanylate cyclase domain-containing protein [Pseudomonadota bacterium]
MLSRAPWAALVFLVLMAVGAVFARPVENFVDDLMHSTISPWTDPPGDIVLVTVTEDTLKQFPYRSPIDRGFLAGLVAKIAEAQPRAIGIDILFDQSTEPGKDAALKAALVGAAQGGTGVPVILAAAGRGDGLSAQQAEYLDAFSSGLGRGLVTLLRDPLDGVVRRVFPGRQTEDGWRQGFVQALAEVAGVEAPRQVRDLVYYRQSGAQPHGYTTYPAHAAAVLPPAWFAGKFVLIGVDLPFDDRHATPFIVPNGVTAGTLPGMVIHAHALAQLLTGDAPSRLPEPVVWLIGIGLCAAAAWLAWRPLPILLKPLVTLGLIAAYWLAGIAGFARFGLDLPLVTPTIGVAGISALAAFLAWRRDSHERQFIQEAFSQYVSPAVVGSILRNPASLRLGGERREITCVFTDLQGFTSFSEKLPPERTAAILNAYLDEMCSLFVEHGATLDKLVGDAVVGFFGAPVDQPDQADRAIALALAVDNFSQGFRKRMEGEGVTLGVTRVGVHSGAAIVGNFGGKRFFDYTAIGDTVNTAARLEGGNKYIGTRLCISDAVVTQAKGETLMRPAGIIYLKGKAEGIEAFEALNRATEDPTYVTEYCEAYRLLKAGEEQAAAAFSRLHEIRPDDSLVEFHRQRLAQGHRGADIRLSEK